LKTYNQTNFFKHTFCEFKETTNFEIPENINFSSKSDSTYFYTNKGVYRKSNHWGRVANCRWKLISTTNYKNQEVVVAFAKWADFYPINSNEKTFFIEVDFIKKTAKIQPTKEDTQHELFGFSESQHRIKQIKHLFKDEKWAKHFDLEIESLRSRIISEFIKTNKSLQEIKKNLK
jgi:hypothetical protein